MGTPILDGIGAAAGVERDIVPGKLARRNPLRRIGQPEEIAAGMVYPASDESRFMTGAGLTPDGGIPAL